LRFAGETNRVCADDSHSHERYSDVGPPAQAGGSSAGERLVFMAAGNWIALYAAVVGTASLAWQAITYVLKRRPKIQIAMMLMRFVLTRDDALAVDPDANVGGHWRIQIEILNQGRSPVRIREVYVETNHDDSGFDSWRSGEWGLPWLLDSLEEKTIYLTSDEVGELARGQQIHAKVTTTSGKDFYSEILEVGGAEDNLVVMPREHFEEIVLAIQPEGRPQFWGPRIQAVGTSPSEFIPRHWLDEQSDEPGHP
jgi:hypothetical protein